MSGTIPNNFLESGFSFSFESAPNYNVTGINNVLIIGESNAAVSQAYIAGSTAALYTPHAVAVIAPDIVTVGNTYGIDSVISHMYTAYRTADPLTSVYLLPLVTANGAASYADYSIGSTSWVASTTSTLNAYVSGTQVQTIIYAGDTTANVMNNLTNAINQNPYFLCTASVSAGSLKLQSKSESPVGSDIDFRFNYNLGDTSQGLRVTYLSGANGEITPDVTDPLANLASVQFDAIVTPYTDSTSMAAYQSLLNQNSGRWSNLGGQMFGFVFTVRKDTFSNLVTFGQNYNTQFVSCLGMPGLNYSAGAGQGFGTPTSVHEAAAYYGGAAVSSLSADVGTPLQALTLNILAPDVQSRFTPSEYNTLLQNGIAIAKVGAGNQVILNRGVTMYRFNNLGIADDTFRDTTTMFTLEYVIETFRQVLSETYPRSRLVDPQTPIPGGSDFTNTTSIESTCIAIYSTLNAQGYVANVSAFSQNVSANSAGNGRVNVYAPITLASPLVQLAVNFVVSTV